MSILEKWYLVLLISISKAVSIYGFSFTEEDEKAETLMDDDIKSLVSEATDQVSREIFLKISCNFFFNLSKIRFSKLLTGTGIGQSREETISQKNDCRFHTIWQIFGLYGNFLENSMLH